MRAVGRGRHPRRHHASPCREVRSIRRTRPALAEHDRTGSGPSHSSRDRGSTGRRCRGHDGGRLGRPQADRPVGSVGGARCRRGGCLSVLTGGTAGGRPVPQGISVSNGRAVAGVVGASRDARRHRARLPVAELPTIWLERDQGMSNFKLVSWLPRYVRWWLFAFGPRIPVEQIRETANRGRHP